MRRGSSGALSGNETVEPDEADVAPSSRRTGLADSAAFVRRALVFLSLSSIAISYYLADAIIKDQPLSVAINAIALVSFALSYWLLRYTPWKRTSVHVMVTGGWLVLGCTSFADGQIYSETLWLIPFLPFVAAHLLGVRAAVVWASICVVWIACVHVIATFVTFTPEAGDTWIDWMILRMVSLVLFTTFGVSARLLADRQIHQLELQRAELEIARERAEAATRAKSTFLANMSHEIRTPLNGILGMAEYLRDCNLGPDEHEAAEIIDRCGQGLLGLLNDILDLSKLEAGKMSLERIPFDLHLMVADLQRLLASRAEAKNLDLRLVYDHSDRWFRGDPTRVRQVVTNLLGNAIKFTQSGHVQLSVETAGDEATPSGVAITVEDTGPGIDPTLQEVVFREFTQADAATARLHGGTGLGLAICRRIVERLGGVLRLSTGTQGGSRFTAELPLEACESASSVDAIQIADSRESPTQLDLHVLIAEDNAVNCRVLERMLAKLRCTWEIATNGRDAVQKTAEGGFDVVLMDMRMPQLDGFEATREIRALDQPARDVAIVAVTANAFESDRDACLAAGMTAFLSKPVRQATLRATLSTIADRRLPAAS